MDRISRREFLQISSMTMGGLVLAGCTTPTSAPVEEPTEKPAEQPTEVVEETQPTAPAVVKPSVAKNDFEAAFEEVGRQLEGDTLVTSGGERDGHYSVCQRAAERFTELTGIETVWELGAVTSSEKFWLRAM